MAMEVEVLGVVGAPEGSILSLRAGGQRRQAPATGIGKGAAFRFTTGASGINPFRVDLLQPVASARLALKPGTQNYSTVLKGTGGDGQPPIRVQFSVCEAGKGPPGGGFDTKPAIELDCQEASPHSWADKASRNVPAKSLPSLGKLDDDMGGGISPAAVVAKDYLEKHSLLPFVRALLQTVIRERPVDPFGFIEEQFRNAASASEAIKGRKADGNFEMTDTGGKPLGHEISPTQDLQALRAEVGATLENAAEDGRLDSAMDKMGGAAVEESTNMHMGSLATHSRPTSPALGASGPEFSAPARRRNFVHNASVGTWVARRPKLMYQKPPPPKFRHGMAALSLEMDPADEPEIVTRPLQEVRAHPDGLLSPTHIQRELLALRELAIKAAEKAAAGEQPTSEEDEIFERRLKARSALQELMKSGTDFTEEEADQMQSLLAALETRAKTPQAKAIMPEDPAVVSEAHPAPLVPFSEYYKAAVLKSVRVEELKDLLAKFAKPKPAKEVAAPPAPVVKPDSLVPFADYYQRTMLKSLPILALSSVYSSMEAARAKASAPALPAPVRAVEPAAAAKRAPPPAAPVAGPAPAPPADAEPAAMPLHADEVAHWSQRPSCGTWVMPRHVRREEMPQPPAANEPPSMKAVAAAVVAATSLSPTAPPPSSAQELWNQRPSCGTWVVPRFTAGRKASSAPVAAAPAAALSVEAPPAPGASAAGRPWHLQASTATWLQKRRATPGVAPPLSPAPAAAAAAAAAPAPAPAAAAAPAAKAASAPRPAVLTPFRDYYVKEVHQAPLDHIYERFGTKEAAAPAAAGPAANDSAASAATAPVEAAAKPVSGAGGARPAAMASFRAYYSSSFLQASLASEQPASIAGFISAAASAPAPPAPAPQAVETAAAAPSVAKPAALVPFSAYYQATIAAVPPCRALPELYGKFPAAAAHSPAAPAPEAAPAPKAAAPAAAVETRPAAMVPFRDYYSANVLPAAPVAPFHAAFAKEKAAAPPAPKAAAPAAAVETRPAAMLPFRAYYSANVLPAAPVAPFHAAFAKEKASAPPAPKAAAPAAAVETRPAPMVPFRDYYSANVLPAASTAPFHAAFLQEDTLATMEAAKATARDALVEALGVKLAGAEEDEMQRQASMESAKEKGRLALQTALLAQEVSMPLPVEDAPPSAAASAAAPAEQTMLPSSLTGAENTDGAYIDSLKEKARSCLANLDTTQEAAVTLPPAPHRFKSGALAAATAEAASSSSSPAAAAAASSSAAPANQSSASAAAAAAGEDLPPEQEQAVREVREKLFETRKELVTVNTSLHEQLAALKAEMEALMREKESLKTH
eukprot:TRINITY_DN15172_c0_g1_i6.p1 TRINITY_DN15172_c0_g1~~TRINITY_DN15172_c0_g1_i6.p1  ORF type:complete len:1324 (-),score=429.97 TRINITY_DN15172_c0_g1_i6:195-4166(-)